MKKFIINTISTIPPVTGIGRYTQEIVRRLPDDGSFEYYYHYALTQKFFTDYTTEGHARGKSVLKKAVTGLPPVKYAAKKLISFLNGLDTSEYDLYWEPSVIPRSYIKAKKRILTLHDMSLVLHPDWHNDDNVAFFKKNLAEIKSSDLIITDTETVKSEIISMLNIPAEKIKPVHLGIDTNIFRKYPQDELSAFKKQTGLPDKFILFTGSIEPRKNLVRLIEAYVSMPESLKNEYRLLLAGYKGWKNSDIQKLIEKEKIVYLGYLPVRQLAYLYNLASLFVFPSLYEGFGLPPVEAMSCGAPVLTSDVSCMPEVCGAGAFYINPLSVESIKEGMVKMLENDNLRQVIKQKGEITAEKYRWENTAEQHYKIFTETA